MTVRSGCAIALRKARRPPHFRTSPVLIPSALPYQQLRAQNTATIEGSEVVAKGTTRTLKDIKHTSLVYPSLKRDSRFSRITAEHVQHFKSLLGKESAVIDGVSHDVSEDIEPFNSDWMRKYRGHTKLVLKPESTSEVSQILKYCNDHVLAVVPQGGNSGLVGGSVPVFDEIVIYMGRMNSIRSFDAVSGTIVLDGGCILEAVDGYLRERKHIFPLDLGAKGSCQVGGNVSTNAGGLRLLRYGSLHGNVLGLEVVLPDGTVLDDLTMLRKNNTGYDLKQLFIGAEGTLGIITGMSVLCPPRLDAINVALLALSSYSNAQKAFQEAKSHLSEILSAFEFMDKTSQSIITTVTSKKPPLEGDHPFYCLIETSGSNAEHDTTKLEKFLESVMESGIVSDGVVAQDESQIRELWSWREGITECVGHWGGVYKYDLSIPLPSLYSLVEDTEKRLTEAGLISKDDSTKPVRSVTGYGHMGDSNLHLNIATRGFDKSVEESLEPWIYEWVKQKKGSISAEHGLGLAKKNYVAYSRNEGMLDLMAKIRGLFDPNKIMNPYKFI